MQRSSLLTVFLACAAVVFLRTGRADAASFQVDPVNLALSAASTNGMLAIRNLADEPVRVQVSVFMWNQTSEGEVDLQPTHDLVFFPSILSIASHEARNIRISAAPNGNFASSTVEKSYRVIVEELLPPMKASLPTATLRVLTRMSVPIFVVPAASKPAPQVEKLSVQGHDATFVVTNAGTKHFMIRSVHLSVTARDGRKLFETSVGGWYVLAQGLRAYKVVLPAAACSTGAVLTVDLETDVGKVTQRLDATCTN